MDHRALYAALRERSLPELLGVLAERAAEPGPQPVVEVTLRSGAREIGVPVRVSTRQGTLALRRVADRFDLDRPTDLVFATLAAIDAVRVIDPMAMIELLSNRGVAPPRSTPLPAPPPTDRGDKPMGLAERRAIAAYQNDKFPEWKKKLQATSGVDLAYEIDWDQMALAGQGESYANNFDFGYFFPLERALQSICADKMGKDAFAAKVKKVKLVHDEAGGYAEGSLAGDTLTITAKAGYVQSENWTDSGIRNLTKTLEDGL